MIYRTTTTTEADYPDDASAVAAAQAQTPGENDQIISILAEPSQEWRVVA